MEYKRVFDKDSKNSSYQLGSYLPDYLADKMQYEHDSGYGRSPRNGVEDRIQRVSQTIGRLLSVLNAKKLLSDSEIFEIIGMDESDLKHEEVELRMPKD